MASTSIEGVEGGARAEPAPERLALWLRDLAVSPGSLGLGLVLHGLIWMLVRQVPMGWMRPRSGYELWVAREGGVFGPVTAVFVLGVALGIGAIHRAGRGRGPGLLALASAGACVVGHGLAFVVMRSCRMHGFQPGTLVELAPALASFAIAVAVGLVALVGSLVRRSRRRGRCLAFCAAVDSALWLVILHILVVAPILRPKAWSDPVPPVSSFELGPSYELRFLAELRSDGSVELFDPTTGRTHRPSTDAELRAAAVEVAGSMPHQLDEHLGRSRPAMALLIVADQGAPYHRLDELLRAVHSDGAEIWRIVLVHRTSHPPWKGNFATYLQSEAPDEPARLEVGARLEGSKLHPTLDRPWSGDGPFRFGPDRELDVRLDGEITESKEEVERLLIDAGERERILSVRVDDDVVVGDVCSLFELYARGAGFGVVLLL